jgi:hypothetical protein
MVDVRQNRKWELEFVYQLAVLVFSIDADGYDFGASSGELLVVCGQTGQLFSAIRSPIAPVEQQHDFALADVIFQRDAGSIRSGQAEPGCGITDLWDCP